MKGTNLFPLSAMEQMLPRVFEQARKKYDGREAQMRKHLASLDCSWSDVVHFSPVSPRLIWEGYIRAGGVWRKDLEWFRIPIQNLQEVQTSWYFSPAHEEAQEAKIPLASCPLMNWEEYKELIELPPATAKYFAESLSAGRAPLLFVGIPHVLAKGIVSIKNCVTETMNA